MGDRLPLFLAWLLAVFLTVCGGRLAEAQEAKTAPEKSRLVITSVPPDTAIRAVPAEQLIANWRTTVAMQALISGQPLTDIGAAEALFNAAFMGPSRKPPLELALPPATYFVSVEFFDKARHVDDPIGELFREAVVGADQIMHSLELNENTGQRKVRFRIKVEIAAGQTIILPLHLISTTIPLEEALAFYPKEERFSVNQATARRSLQERGLEQSNIDCVLSALKRGGVVYLPNGKNVGFLVQVRADGSLFFTEKNR